jgi:hypothetical protein
MVADHILALDRHRADVHWHVDSSWTLEGASTRCARLTHPDALSAAIASTPGDLTALHGDAEGLGWCAPVYGRVIPSLTLRFSEAGQGPFSLVTAIVAARGPVELALASTPVAIERDDGWHRAAVVGTHGDRRVVALFATPLDGAHRLNQTRPGRAAQSVRAGDGELITDARMAILQISSAGEPISLGLIDSTAAAWTGRGNFSIGTFTAAKDLHLDRTALTRLSRRIETTCVG